jgi:hypothetical protein
MMTTIDPSPAASGLVSAFLERDLLANVQRGPLRLWLDKESAYTSFAERLAQRHREGAFAVPVIAFHGSFLELLGALEASARDLDPLPLIVHLPGLTQDAIRQTPLLAAYRAGARYEKALPTLVREAAEGKVAPAEVESFLGAPDLSLAAADEWLAERMGGARGGFETALEVMGLDGVAGALMVGNPEFVDKLASEANRARLWQAFRRWTGVEVEWRRFSDQFFRGDDARKLADALLGWLLAVEYVDDLRRPPLLDQLQAVRALPKGLRQACRRTVEALRERHPDDYERTADRIQGCLHDELTRMEPADLGQMDTFRVEEERLLQATVDAMLRGEWTAAASWSATRQRAAAFWLSRRSERRLVWALVREAAALGEALATSGRPMDACAGFEDALDRYTRAGFEVDRRHRHFAEAYERLLRPSYPHFEKLRDIGVSLRRLYRTWADQLARDFAAMCRREGALPASDLQQRTFYDDVVQPLKQRGEQTALILVDALRFEMAADLRDALHAKGTDVELRGRLAELPTMTAVGMNALAPVALGGKLTMAGDGGFRGFRAAETTVFDWATRAQAMGGRSLGKKMRELDLDDVAQDSIAGVRQRLAGEPLVLIHTQEIDDAGEAGVELRTFSSTLDKLERACAVLLAAGVENVMVTADHGFLLQDDTTAEVSFGTRRDASRRHALAEQAVEARDALVVPLATLGYVDSRGNPASGALVLREDTAVFVCPGGSGRFVHGGNSPQERVIPVLHARPRRRLPVETSPVLEGRSAGSQLGLYRIELRAVVEKKQPDLFPMGKPAPVLVGLRVATKDISARVIVRQASRATLRGEHMELAVGPEWAEVLFTIEGEAPTDDPVDVEAHLVTVAGKGSACSLEGPFFVAKPGAAIGDQATIGAAKPITHQGGEDWRAGIEEVGVRRVFEHIEKYGVITEPEVITMLGDARALRRFSRAFDALAERLPFLIRIETAPSGKRYVKEGDR